MTEPENQASPIQQGQADAEELLPLIYDELRQLAAWRLAGEKPGQTLQPTALVHEAWLRIAGAHDQRWDGKAHFFAAAGQAMRRILIEKARRRQRLEHGGDCERVDLPALDIASPLPDNDLLALDEALTQLVAVDNAAAELVKLRFFVGLTHEEAAELLGISRSTADRTWVFARAWLFQQIQSGKS